MPRPDPKFTPGQWEVISRREIADDPKYIVIGAGNTGAAIVGQYEGMEVDRRWANARLIAAAPDLYENLARMVEHFEIWANDHSMEATTETWSALHCARAALARADGAGQ